jgi:hypothetical protein
MAGPDRDPADLHRSRRISLQLDHVRSSRETLSAGLFVGVSTPKQ